MVVRFDVQSAEHERTSAQLKLLHVKLSNAEHERDLLKQQLTLTRSLPTSASAYPPTSSSSRASSRRTSDADSTTTTAAAAAAAAAATSISSTSAAVAAVGTRALLSSLQDDTRVLNRKLDSLLSSTASNSAAAGSSAQSELQHLRKELAHYKQLSEREARSNAELTTKLNDCVHKHMKEKLGWTEDTEKIKRYDARFTREQT